jgi:hypothetical protein
VAAGVRIFIQNDEYLLPAGYDEIFRAVRLVGPLTKYTAGFLFVILDVGHTPGGEDVIQGRGLIGEEGIAMVKNVKRKGIEEKQ